MSHLKTFIYIDGFNLYYGSLKRSPYKWLNPKLLCQNILSDKNEILSIKYFTAAISARKNDPQITTRQNMYFRALQTIDEVQIIKGHYITHPKKMKLLNPPLYKKIINPLNRSERYHKMDFVEVLNTEEKGSDVNLATHLLVDTFENQFDVAVVITNDSDLALPVKLVKNLFKKKIIILNPHPEKQKSVQLNNYSTKVIQITKEHLHSSQFETQIIDTKGIIVKPDKW